MNMSLGEQNLTLRMTPLRQCRNYVTYFLMQEQAGGPISPQPLSALPRDPAPSRIQHGKPDQRLPVVDLARPHHLQRL